MNVFIAGGTSGLGLELAKKFRDTNYSVIVSGRKDPKEQGIEFRKLALNGSPTLKSDIEEFVSHLPKVEVFVYAAGFYQEGTLTEISTEQINEMFDVGLHAPVWFAREILQQHGSIKKFVAITSTSQWTPRLKEPIYTATKAGLGHFANSLSLDPRVQQTLVVGPAGMRTNFWRMTEQDQSGYNSPTWVANEIYEALEPAYSYAFIRLLRDPARAEIVETRA